MNLNRSAGIIIKNGEILLMHRQKPGRDYFVIPGGDIEEGETAETTVLREIKEETSLDTEIDYLIFELENDVFKKHESFFVMKNIQGEAKIGEPELSWENENNKYDLQWIKLEKISEINLVPLEAKQKIIEKFV